jgi:hypothetical protein
MGLYVSKWIQCLTRAIYTQSRYMKLRCSGTVAIPNGTIRPNTPFQSPFSPRQSETKTNPPPPFLLPPLSRNTTIAVCTPRPIWQDLRHSSHATGRSQRPSMGRFHRHYICLLCPTFSPRLPLFRPTPQTPVRHNQIRCSSQGRWYLEDGPQNKITENSSSISSRRRRTTTIIYSRCSWLL